MLTVNRILLIIAVDILGERSQGVNVANLIINTTGRHETLKRGCYVTLHRMVDLGLLRKLRGSKHNARPFYRLTALGRKELKATLKEFADLGKLQETALRKRK